MEHTNKNNQDLTNQLFKAIENNNLQKVKNILAQGVDVNKPSHYGTPLNIAAYRGRIEVIKELLKYEGIDVNKPSYYGTPLNIAVSNNNTKIITVLLKKNGIKSLYKEDLKDLFDTEKFKETLTKYITNFVLNHESLYFLGIRDEQNRKDIIKYNDAENITDAIQNIIQMSISAYSDGKGENAQHTKKLHSPLKDVLNNLYFRRVCDQEIITTIKNRNYRAMNIILDYIPKGNTLYYDKYLFDINKLAKIISNDKSLLDSFKKSCEHLLKDNNVEKSSNLRILLNKIVENLEELEETETLSCLANLFTQEDEKDLETETNNSNAQDIKDIKEYIDILDNLLKKPNENLLKGPNEEISLEEYKKSKEIGS